MLRKCGSWNSDYYYGLPPASPHGISKRTGPHKLEVWFSPKLQAYGLPRGRAHRTASGTGPGQAKEAPMGSGPTEAALQPLCEGPAYHLGSLFTRSLRLHALTLRVSSVWGGLSLSLNTTALDLPLILSTHFVLPGRRASFLSSATGF